MDTVYTLIIPQNTIKINRKQFWFYAIFYWNQQIICYNYSMNLSKIKTYIYIDVSNIRSACLNSCGFNLDFVKLYEYFHKKYENIQDIRYYEGIARGDKKKQQHFQFLHRRIGYTICSLERKSYKDPPQYKNFECTKCGAINKVQVLPEHINLKSNVDVYLATDMLSCAATNQGEEIHIILVSCDGDYAEAIRSIAKINKEAFITIVATPRTRENNRLSSRLQTFANRNSKNTALMNIATIKDYISQPIPDKTEN